MVKQTNVSILHAIFPLGFFHVPRSEEPSHLKRLAREVTDFLETLKEESGGRVDYQVVDPESDNPDSEDLEAYAAKRRVSPFPVRSVTRDASARRPRATTPRTCCGCSSARTRSRRRPPRAGRHARARQGRDVPV